MAFSLAWVSIWSVPQASDWLRQGLEQRNPVVAEATLPHADAIVVLGGGSRYSWLDQEDVRPEELRSSRLAAGARAWLAARAPLVVLSGGGEGRANEARMMAAAIRRLGIPESALVLEQRSTNTKDNAFFTAALGQQLGIQRVLLVTSSLHMPRAHLLFCQAGMDVTPIPVPELVVRKGWRDRWFPTRSALWRSGRALKEYVALFAAFIEMKTSDDESCAGRQNK